MKTYILKYDIYNDTTFPKGTIVKVNDWQWEFEVTEGKLKGQKGHIADGMDGWLIENTPEMKTMVKDYFAAAKKIDLKIKELNQMWGKIKTEKEPK